jgi:hypothetical protein
MSSRCIQQIKPILLVYHVEEHLLKLNIREENSLLQLIFSSDRNSTEQLQKLFIINGMMKDIFVQQQFNSI